MVKNKHILSEVAFSLSNTIFTFQARMAMIGNCSNVNFNDELVKLLSHVQCDASGHLYIDEDDSDRYELDEDGIPTGITLTDLMSELTSEVIEPMLDLVGHKAIFELSCSEIKGPVGIFLVTELYNDDSNKYK